MLTRTLYKETVGPHQDWYGNNAALHCPLCNKLFIVSGFINGGQRKCPNCDGSTARIENDKLILEWPNEQNIPVVMTRDDLVSTNRLDEFVTLVRDGGAVSRASIAANLDKAERIAFLERDGRMIAVAAQKRPAEAYIRRVSEQSQYVLDQNVSELGYVAVAKNFQGQHLSNIVVKRILFEFGNQELFATTSEVKMRSVLAKNGFHWVGHEWKSERPNQKLSLWIGRAR